MLRSNLTWKQANEFLHSTASTLSSSVRDEFYKLINPVWDSKHAPQEVVNLAISFLALHYNNS
jgi:hypothetical protein